MSGYTSEARGWLDQALATTTDPPVRSALLRGAASLAFYQDELPRSQELHEELIAFGRATGQLVPASFSLGRLALITMRSTGDLEQAMARADEGLALSREIGNPWSIGHSQHNRAMVAMIHGDVELAESAWEEALGLFRATGTTAMVAHIVNNLGRIAMSRGDFELAATHCEEALGLFRQRGDFYGVLSCLQNLLRRAYARRDAAQTRSISLEILPMIRHQGSPLFAANALGMLAWAVCEQGEPLCAARLLGAAEKLREMSGSQITGPDDRRRVDDELAALQQALGQEALSRARAAGQVLTLEQAIAEALRAAADPSDESGTLT